LTHSGRLTHKVVTRLPWIRRRSGKVRRLQTDILTTEPRRQQKVQCVRLAVEWRTLKMCCYRSRLVKIVDFKTLVFTR